MEAETVIQEYCIPSENIETLKAKFEKLQRKARRIGYTGVLRLNIGEIQEETHKNSSGYTTVSYWYPVTVEGEAPVIPGYAFIATLEHTEAGVIVRAVPGMVAESELVAWRGNVTQECQHCGLRRNRNDTFLIREEATKTVKQIGRQCLRAYMGYESPEHLADLATILQEVDELGSSCSGGRGESALLEMDFFLENHFDKDALDYLVTHKLPVHPTASTL